MSRQILLLFSLILITSHAFEFPECSANCSVSNCAICSNTTCTSCLLGYTLSSNACTINTCSVSNCSLCDSQGACIQCKDPYSTFNSSSGSCVQTCAISNCDKCKAGSKVCQICSSGYARYQWNDQCIPTIILNCEIIYDFQQQEFLCSKCAAGFKPTQDQAECIVDNLNCSSITDCAQCNGSICLTCRKGYSPSNNGTACISNLCNISGCLYCQDNGGCLRCLSNNTLINNTCSVATCSIAGCSVCKSNSQFCDVCQGGYMVNIWTRQCQNRTNNITNCQSFMIDSSNQLRCVSCGLGLVPSADRFSCISNCPSGCLNCTNSSYCSTCSAGYSFSIGNCSINVCSSSHCILCLSNQTCLQCDDYSTLSSNGTCISVCSLPFCSLCKIHSQECQQCASGYAINKWNKKCFAPPIGGCKIVLDYSQQEFMCTKCENGLIPSSDQLACVPDCNIATNNCSNSSYSSCRDGYKLTQDRSCIIITCSISNCLLCESSTRCMRCMSNYTLSNGQCTMAQCLLPNCKTCKTGSIFCDVCSDAYALNIWSGACEQLLYPITNCIAFRKDSSNQNRCVQCSNQLIPSSDAFSCVTNCPSHCSACSNGQCSACEKGFYLKNSSCIAYTCSSDCQVCDSNRVCLTCLNPEQSYNSLFKLCQSSCSLPNCASCLPNSQICSQCTSGYALYGWNGQCRPSPIANCKLIYDFRGQQYICSRCLAGYVPTSDQAQCMLANCSTIDNCQTCNSSMCSSCRIGYYLSANKMTCSPNLCNVSNCLYCSSALTCLRCSSSFILVTGQCQKAYCNLPFCSSCKQQSQFCDLCNSGYTWNVWTNQCQKSIIQNCDASGSINRINYQCFACAANQTCNQCNSIYTYQNSSNLCTPTCNISNCAKCMTSQLCSECANGFVLDQSFLSCKLQCAVTNCAKCLASSSICDKCASGYVLINNTCQEDVCKIDNCLTCASVSSCESCLPMFTLSQNGTCVSICPLSNCRVCSSYITCESCSVGYAPASSYQCLPICSISNCLLCSDSSACAACADGFTLSANKDSCNVKCLSSNCAQCSSLDSCTTCLVGFTVMLDDFGKGICIVSGCSIGLYPNPTNSSQCLNCSLAGCDACSSATACVLCKPTYYLNNASCSLCSTKYSNCLICSQLSCLQCQLGYAKNAQNVCTMIMKGNCSSACLVCSNGTCVQCSISFYLNSNSICMPKCASGVFTGDACACSPGLYMSNSICVACRDKNCLACDQIKCSRCATGYYPLLDACVDCMSNCESCTSGAICDKCLPGFSLSEFTCKFNYLSPNSTSQCPFGCATCTFFKRVPYCIKLNDGFSLGFNSSIIQCAPSCKTCASDNTTLCLSCYAGLLNYGACSSCNDMNCQSCSSDMFTCSNCNPSFTLSLGVCMACSSNCIKCNVQGPGLCDDGGCLSGYVAQSYSHQCVKCLNGCTSCNSLDFTVCLSCSMGSYLSKGACVSCPSGCSTCYSQSICTKCSIGYELMLGTCYMTSQLPCKQSDASNKCIGCINNYQLINSTCTIILSSVCSSNCTQCPFNYYISNRTCQPCPSISKCLQCDSNNINICLKCSSGYYWNGNACTACDANCQLCSGPSRCFLANSGYYLAKNAQNGVTGSVARCKLTCATCSAANHCTSCPSNWRLVGVQCVSASSINLEIIFVPSFMSWDQTWTSALQQSNAIKNWPQIYARVQSLLRVNASDNGVLMPKSIVCGSINLTATRIVGSNENPSAVQSQLVSSLQVGTSGLNIISTNMISSSTTTSSNNNTSTIVGVVVGVGGAIIIIIIFIICYLYKRKKASVAVDNIENQVRIQHEGPDLIESRNNQFTLTKQEGSSQMGFDLTKMKDTFSPMKDTFTPIKERRDSQSYRKERNSSESNLVEDNQSSNGKLMMYEKLHINTRLKPIQKKEEISPTSSKISGESQSKLKFDPSRVENLFNRTSQLQSILEVDQPKLQSNLGDMEVEFNIDSKLYE